MDTVLGRIPLNTGAGRFGVIREQVHGFAGQLSAMLSYHNKTFVAAITVTQLVGGLTQSNYEFSHWLKHVTRRLRRQLKVRRLAYGWVREREKSSKSHYHLVFMIDGNRYQNAFWLAERLRQKMPPASMFSVGYAKGRMVRRGHQSTVDQAMYWLSYYCKSRTKNLDRGIRKCGFSQLGNKQVD